MFTVANNQCRPVVSKPIINQQTTARFQYCQFPGHKGCDDMLLCQGGAPSDYYAKMVEWKLSGDPRRMYNSLDKNQNFFEDTQVYTVLQPWRSTWTYSPPWYPRNFRIFLVPNDTYVRNTYFFSRIFCPLELVPASCLAISECRDLCSIYVARRPY